MLIKELTIEDYQAVVELWQGCKGIGLNLRDVDSKEGIGRYLQRNPGLSFIAIDKSRVVGTILCGHDGRRGYINHLAVAEKYRKSGLGKELVQKVLQKLRAIGIVGCNGMVFNNNTAALEFYKKIGFSSRSDLIIAQSEIVL